MCSPIFITAQLLIFMFNMKTYCMCENFINTTFHKRRQVFWQHTVQGSTSVFRRNASHSCVNKSKYIISKNDLSVFFNKIYFATEDKNSNQFIIELSRTYVAKILRSYFLYNEKNFLLKFFTTEYALTVNLIEI